MGNNVIFWGYEKKDRMGRFYCDTKDTMIIFLQHIETERDDSLFWCTYPHLPVS